MLSGVTKEYMERLDRVAKAHQISAPVEQRTDTSALRDYYQGRLNGRAFASAEPWMRPNWVITALARGRQPESPEEDFPNNSYRNWAVIGGVGSGKFGIVDKKGLLTALPECGSIEFWPGGKDGPIFPALEESAKLEQLSPEDQVFEMTILSGPVELRRLIYHASEEGVESVYNEIVVRNYTLEKTRFNFYVAVRPMSVAGVEPIEELKFDASSQSLYINGLLACTMDNIPSALVMSTADNPSLLSTIVSSDTINQEYSTPKGLGTAILRFTVELPPAGSERFFFVCPLEPSREKDSKPQFTFETIIRDKSVERWFNFAGPSLAGILPESYLTEALAQAKASLVTQARSFIDQTLASPDNADWYEIARILHAMTTSGASDLACDLSQGLVQKTASKGTDWGASFYIPIMWTILRSFEYGTLANHVSWTSDFLMRSLTPVLALMYQSVARRNEQEAPESTEEESPKPVEPEWIKQLREEIKKLTGKNPAKESLRARDAEIVVSDDLRLIRLKAWGIAVLKLAQNFLRNTGESDKALLIAGFVVHFEKDLKSSLQEESVEECSPHDALSFLSSAALLGISDLAEFDAISNLIDSARSRISRGLIRLQGPPERFSSHLSLRLAHYYTSQLKRHDAEVLLEKALENLFDFGTLPDSVNPKSGGGSFGSGSSILAAADLFLLARNMILVEEGQNLILLPGIPEDWYTSSSGLTIKRIPTNFGAVDFEMGSSANQHQVEISMEHLPEEIDLHVPMSFSIPLVKVFGAGIVGRFPREDSPHVKVVPLNERVVFTFHR